MKLMALRQLLLLGSCHCGGGGVNGGGGGDGGLFDKLTATNSDTARCSSGLAASQTWYEPAAGFAMVCSASACEQAPLAAAACL